MSSANTNKQILLKKRPDGPLTTDLFEVSEAALPSPGTNQFLVRTEWLSLDPFMVGRMRAEANYAQGVQLGDVMQASAVGRVIESNNDEFPVGNLYVGMFGLQEYAVSDGSNVSLEVDPGRAPASMALGILGMPGMTAYFGLLKAGEPREGETVLVSACGGPVGSLVGQIAKINGCRAVGITSVEEKRRYAIDEFGFDEVVLYKDGQGNPLPKAALTERIGAACPEGVDVYFDNVGGDIYDATLPNFNIRGRIVVCGRVAAADAERFLPRCRPAGQQCDSGETAAQTGFPGFRLRCRQSRGTRPANRVARGGEGSSSRRRRRRYRACP